MPRNPKALALEKARKAQANYRKAEESLGLLRSRRDAAMVECVAAGCSKAEVGRVFNVSPVLVHTIVKRAEGRAA